MPQHELLRYLDNIGLKSDELKCSDCSILPSKRFPELRVVSTTDFFYPLIDDPYVMGKIGCANVLSDLYSVGISECDTLLMLLAASEEVPPELRANVTSLLMKGFSDLARDGAGVQVSGGQSVRNPWPIIGGVATSVVAEQDIIRPENAVAGDLVVLTKPVGIQLVVNAHQWLANGPTSKFAPRLAAAKEAVTEEEIQQMYATAVDSMARLNRVGAKMMHKYGAHAATDVTGFGLKGHSENLMREQKARLGIEIDTIPAVAHVAELDKKMDWGVLEGVSAETSGGLLVCLPKDRAQAFCDDMLREDGYPAWIVGRVVERAPNSADYSIIAEKPHVINV